MYSYDIVNVNSYSYFLTTPKCAQSTDTPVACGRISTGDETSQESTGTQNEQT